MKWKEIKQKYPKKFILLGSIDEERISQNSFRVLGGKVLMTTDDPKKVLKAYKVHQEKGENVLYSLPSTTEDFIVEEAPFLGILQ